MNTIIIYKSYLGSTKKYANWLAEDLKADICTFGEVNKIDWSKYNTVIVASGTYAGKMPLTNFLQKNWENLKTKKVIVVSVGISPEGVPYTDKILNRIPENIRTAVKIVRLPGNMFGIMPKETGPVEKENIKRVTKLLH